VWAAALGVGLVLMVASCGGGAAVDDAWSGGSAQGPADYSYTIPVGAGEALDRGEPLAILPAELTVEVGQMIEIVNEDDRGHLLGPFYVGAGETLRQRFSSEGSFVGVCTVHPSGEFVLTVVER
jgi:plastocyanin